VPRGWVALVHRAAEQGYFRKSAQPIYATFCMSIRPALQTVASTSHMSINPLG
jgi:hypothetical protein